MRKRTTWIRGVSALALVAGLGLTGCGSSGEGSEDSTSKTTAAANDDEVGNVRGFDGSTIKLAAIGIKGQLPGVEWGVKARMKRFNDTNEIPGVKLEFTEFVDDKQDPATTLSEMRRLVTAEKVFAVINYSQTTPGEYMKQEHVPYFGYAFDFTYCSAKPNPETWGFGFNGCLVPKAPSKLGDFAARLYKYATKEIGKDAPTIAVFSNDTQSGQDAARFQAIAYKGAGFDVILSKGIIPPPPVSDYTPYVQQLLKADGGKAPEVIQCLLSIDCIPIYKQLKAAGYPGIFAHSLYSDQLTEAMAGSVVNNPYRNLADPSPERDNIKADVAAVKADQPLETGDVTAYLATDMFIQALKTAAKGGKSGITPENVQKAAASQTWKLGTFAGPTKYPDATVTATPSCSTVLKSNGKVWETVIPFECSDKQFPVTG